MQQEPENGCHLMNRHHLAMREKSLGNPAKNIYYPDSFTTVPTENREHPMKIQPDMTQPKTVQKIENRTDDNPGIAQKKIAAKKLEKGDVVELSAARDQELAVRQEENRAKQVAAIKSQITAGTYQVSARAVAQKMLS